MTAGPMRVGWAHADCSPGCQLGSDEYTWAFDGYNVSTSLSNFSQVTLIIILRPQDSHSFETLVFI